MSRAVALFAFVFPAILWGCTPSIGDSCQSGLDCSAQGSRLCDLTQRGGYCTLPGCDTGTCPDEAVCVLFRPETPRLSVSYCMLECEDDSDCRDGEGYRCLTESDFGLHASDATAAESDQALAVNATVAADDEDAGVDGLVTVELVPSDGESDTLGAGREAKVLDGAKKRFCAQPASLDLVVTGEDAADAGQ